METIKVFRKNCPDPHDVKVAGIVFTQVTNNSTVEAQSMEDIKSAASKEGTYLFTNSLKYSKSFARSIKDQTPIFETLHAKKHSRAGIGKIAEEMKLQIAAGPAKKVKK
jgi:cellulose biosynthesis protein BcsQ